ncbi:MAG: hydroxymethylglutaryl-CoA synthase [Myxococcota bacterium]
MTQPGLSGLSVYVPPLRVNLEDWCDWNDKPWPKIRKVVGRSFRIPGPRESIYTMAANAVLRLVEAYEIDPRDVGFLGFGTESSTDNSAGAIIVKGMVDRALEELGEPRLARSCEVPEFKHACLGGIYALKAATRYLGHDGRDKKAIVVCGDIAEYARGSSGEQTQGAGAVAMLLEAEPKLMAVDLAHAGSSADYRGGDFRKPVRRHFMDGYEPGASRLHDFPVFNGRYSTYCYLDATIRAADDLVDRLETTPRALYDSLEGLFFHRPYHMMPVQAMAAMHVWGLARNPEDHDDLRALCEAAGEDFDAVLAETSTEPDLYARFVDGQGGEDPHPAISNVARAYRKSDAFETFQAEKMSLGADAMRDLGNLYTAALPAWIAAGLEHAAVEGLSLDDAPFLLVGYGSGDAAEAIPTRLVPGWKEAARRIGFADALADPIDLTQAQYEALHDGRHADVDATPTGFVVERVGESDDPSHQDIGLEYYRYVR